MKKLILIPLIFISISIFAQKAKIINHRFIAPRGIVIITKVIIPEPIDTIKVLNCGEVFECGVIFGCETSYIDIELLNFMDDYFKNEKELII
jgi:hypothetical protein